MRTTDGPAFDATSMTAEFSSTVTGWRTEPVPLESAVELATGEAVRSNAPVAFRTATVPPEARSAAASAAATTVPAPVPARDGEGRLAAVVWTGWEDVSNQRSGVGWEPAQWPPAHEERGSGVGE